MVFLFINLLLPNIFGYSDTTEASDSEDRTTGAFSQIILNTNADFQRISSSSKNIVALEINASKASSIYTNNGTIKPQCYGMLVLLRI